MDNVVDFLAFRESQKKLEALSKMPDLTKLGHAELATILQSVSKVVLQQSDLIAELMQEQVLATESFMKLQEQCSMISLQAYVALEILKEKGVATPEEVSAMWQKVIKEKVYKGQEPSEDGSHLSTGEASTVTD